MNDYPSSMNFNDMDNFIPTAELIPDPYRFPCADPIPRGGKTLVMAIINLTPDSFSGQNSAGSPEEAVILANKLLDEGADIIDIGAESSRPGAETISVAEECRRLGSVVKLLRDQTRAPISVDTRNPVTAAAVLDEGADIINDITALRGDWGRASNHNREMADIIAGAGAHAVLMHMPASPAEMDNSTEYRDVVAEVRDFLEERSELATRAGIHRDRIWLDPGFGFGKTFHHNRELLVQLGAISDLGFPIAVGLSRKRLISDVTALPPDQRLEGSVALAVIASLTGADLVRVHDVRPTSRALAMADAIRIG